jgi:uncharacterized RDD family membrane protein YckC
MSRITFPKRGGSGAMSDANERKIAGFWRRFFAYVADAIIVGVPCLVITTPLFNKIPSLGVWGPLIGFLIALPYFALMDSKIGKGQTLGKRWRHVRVVDKDGNLLPVRKSFIRYTIFAGPFFLNGAYMPMDTTVGTFAAVAGTVILALNTLNFYLLIFNRHTRQGLHDLLVGSYVVKADQPGAIAIQPIWKAHWGVCGLIVILILGIQFFGHSAIEKNSQWSSMFDDLMIVKGLDDVSGASVTAGTSHFSSSKGSESKHVMNIQVQLTRYPDKDELYAAQLVKKIMDHDANAKTYDAINVVLAHTYNVGILSWNSSHAFSHSPIEWSKCLTDQKSEN